MWRVHLQIRDEKYCAILHYNHAALNNAMCYVFSDTNIFLIVSEPRHLNSLVEDIKPG